MPDPVTVLLDTAAAQTHWARMALGAGLTHVAADAAREAAAAALLAEKALRTRSRLAARRTAP